MEKLYVNENFPYPVVEFLRDFGYDVLTSLDTGNANQKIPDEKVLEFAINQNRIFLTLNRRDFIRLHRNKPLHYGIIVCTENTDFKELAELIQEKLQENKNTFQNQIMRVNKPS